MIFTTNSNKNKVVKLPNRTSTSDKVEWGLLWDKDAWNFTVLPNGIKEIPNASMTKAITEVTEFLHEELAIIDRINELFNCTTDKTVPTKVVQVNPRKERTWVATTRHPGHDDFYLVLQLVDNDFSLVENLLDGNDVKLIENSFLYQQDRVHVTHLVGQMLSGHLVRADRLRNVIEALKRESTSAKISDKIDKKFEKKDEGSDKK